MSKSHASTQLAEAAKVWALSLRDAQGSSALNSIDDALIALMPKLTRDQMNCIRVLIGKSSSCAYSQGIRDGKKMQRDNEFREFQQDDSTERPMNVVKFRA